MQAAEDKNGGGIPMPRGVERNPITVIIYSLISCGIYGIYWLYMVSKEINDALGEERLNFLLYFLLGLFCFPLYLYGIYKLDQAVVELQTRTGLVGKSNFILWIILYFVGGVGSIIMQYQTQEALNEIWTKA